MGLGAAVVAASAIALAAPLGAPEPSPIESPTPAVAQSNLLDYFVQPGDQIVTVPNGTYNGGTISAPHPETTGRYDGWLILQAETKHGVTVTGELRLEAGTSRILLVGFQFRDARVFVSGEHVALWYSDHQFPDTDWYVEGRPIPRQVFFQYPGRFISLLGADLHNGVASPINISGVNDLGISGVLVYDLSEPLGSDPEDLSHLNVISLLAGATTNLTVSHSYFRGARLNHQTNVGDVTGLRYEDVWFTGAWGAAFHYHATNGNRFVDCVRIDVRSWDHIGELPLDRIDIVDGVVVPAGSRPDRVDVSDRSVMTDPPPEGAENPADRWRRWHPYDSWPEYFGWADPTVS